MAPAATGHESRHNGVPPVHVVVAVRAGPAAHPSARKQVLRGRTTAPSIATSRLSWCVLCKETFRDRAEGDSDKCPLFVADADADAHADRSG
jgi:hypothetical protein